MKRLLRLYLVGAIGFGASFAHAEGPVFNAFEKVAVFPVAYEDASGTDEAMTKSLEEVWWQVREELTETGRFLVASRAFLQRLDAFQPRGQLSTADAVILSRYVEADVLITIKLKARTLSVTAWEGRDGSRLWEETVELHPSVLVRDQIATVAKKLTREFVSKIPFHGLTQVDPLTRTPVFDDGGRRLVRVKVGIGARISEGDEVQWLSMRRTSFSPLFLGGGKVDVLAAGRVVSIKDQVATVEVTRLADLKEIQAATPVAFPAEAARLNQKGDDRQRVSELANQILRPTETAAREESKSETRPLATTLSILASLAAVLLLAF